MVTALIWGEKNVEFSKAIQGKLPKLSFKVIDVDKSKKPVTSACYDITLVCTYLQLFSHYNSQ